MSIQQIIQQLSGTYLNDEVRMLLGRVVSVDESSRTCKVDAVTGETNITMEAKLMASIDDGILCVPEVDSQVVVLYSKQNEPIVFFYSALSKIKYIVGNTGIEITGSGIVMNDGKLNGLVKIADLVTKLNNIEKAFNAHLTKYNTHTHTGVQPGSGSSAVPAQSDNGTLTVTKQSDIENTKITHGSSL